MKKLQMETKQIRRIPPCPSYHVEAMESWLESMARDGYFLRNDGFFLGRATFDVGAPRKVRYRLQAAPKRSLLDDMTDRPSEEALEISEALGWRYVASQGRFQIYYCADPDARELNTDPEVQSLSIDVIHSQERSSLLSALLWWLLYPLIWLRHGAFTTAIGIGSALYIGGLSLVMWRMVASIRKVLYLYRLRKRLAAGNTLQHSRRWGKSRRYYAERILFVALLIVWLGGFFYSWKQDEANKKSLIEYQGSLPFAAIEDLDPKGVYTTDNGLGLGNTIERKTDLLAREVIELVQIGTLRQSNGKVISGGLLVRYYDTVSPFIAQRLAREQQARDRWNNRKRYEPLELPTGLNVDYAVGYRAVFPTVILRQGRRIIHIVFYQTGPETLQLEEWIPTFADYFTEAK